MKKLFYLPLILVSLFMSCQVKDQTSRLKLTMIDSPGDYDEVNIDIQGVSMNADAQAGVNDNGWKVFAGSDVGIKNLLDYTAGNELTLVDTQIPAGRISQIRLILGTGNSVKIGAVTEPLETPSAQQSGLKLQVNETLRDGITYNFKLDFDASRSVVRTGNNKYILKPVIKVITEATSGAIKGTITPSEENVAVYVINGSDTVASTYAPTGVSGFMAAGIPAGHYSLGIDPGESSTYKSASLDSINVSTGNVTDVGLIQLSPK